MKGLRRQKLAFNPCALPSCCMGLRFIRADLLYLVLQWHLLYVGCCTKNCEVVAGQQEQVHGRGWLRSEAGSHACRVCVGWMG
jgi:hypothetical protein